MRPRPKGPKEGGLRAGSPPRRRGFPLPLRTNARGPAALLLPLLLPVLLAALASGCAGSGSGAPRPPAATAPGASAETPGWAATVPPSSSPEPAPSPRPNLVVIFTDDHRWDALGVAGNSHIHTPEMDALANAGVYFRQATVSVSQCHPVRASLLTGLPTFRHGVYSVQYQEPGVEATICRRPTVASLLRDAGYRTVLVGKWHIPASPVACGFDEPRTWLPGGSADYRDPELVRGDSETFERVAGSTQEIFGGDATRFLRSEAARQGPFLLWLGFTAPHFPYEPNPERIEALYAGKSEAELQPPGFPGDVKANDWRHYDEAVSHLDEQVGTVLAALRESGLAENTVVVLLGDNGYMMGERGVGGPGSRADGKQVPYESSIRVPFLLQGPGLPQGLASDLPVSNLDLPPTLLALAGVPAPADWPGRDLAAALAGRRQVGEAFTEWADEKSDKFGKLAYRAVRTPSHKLIVWKDPKRPEELYDLKADPRESRNLATAPEARAILEDLRRRLRAWMEENGDPALGWGAE